ncbi:hypothetical protein G6M26_31900 [Agrobacterium tumefaciens]|nr:hypothetical protein [Agrobacterium tumefaciens]NTE23153.1 hypothetical protein [Agrobacterium tumefaciens]
MIFNEMTARSILLSEAAGNLKIHPNNISGWRRGSATPSIIAVEELAESIGRRLTLEEIPEPGSNASLLTAEERRVMNALVSAWNSFLLLPEQHPDDVAEFRHGIHYLQDKLFARPARATENGLKEHAHDE